MQYCPSGNMCHYLVEHPETNRVDIVSAHEILHVLQVDSSRKFQLYDIVAGMTCLHNKHVVHADLKGVTCEILVNCTSYTKILPAGQYSHI
jgi:hypothetical protein